MKRSVLCLLFLLFFASAFANAELQKPFVDSTYGYRIALPEKWESQPLPPPSEYKYLGLEPAVKNHFEFFSVQTTCKFRGPKEEAFEEAPLFTLHKFKTKEFSDAIDFARQYANIMNLGDPEVDETLKARSSKTKTHALEYLQTMGIWKKKHKYYVVEQPNGFFLLCFEYDTRYPEKVQGFVEDIEDSAKSFKYSKIVLSKKKEENGHLPQGWEEIEGSRYVIQFNGGDKTVIKEYLKLLEQLDKLHKKLVPEDKKNERKRPKEQGVRDKLLVKYFKDKTTFTSYASLHGGDNMGSYYSRNYDEIVFFDTGFSEISISGLLHEATYMYFHNFVGGRRVEINMWLDAGLAEYYLNSAFKVAGEIHPGFVRPSCYGVLSEFQRIGTLPPVATFLKWDRKTYYSHPNISNPYGCALVHFLLHNEDKKYTEVIPTYFHELQRHSFPLLQKLFAGGKECWLAEGDELSEGQKICMELEKVCDKAQQKAFYNIDDDVLQDDFTAYVEKNTPKEEPKK